MFQSQHRLDAGDAIIIAKAADKVKNLDKKVTWLQAGLDWQTKHKEVNLVYFIWV